MNSLGSRGNPRGLRTGGFTAQVPDWNPPKKKKKKKSGKKAGEKQKKESGKKQEAIREKSDSPKPAAQWQETKKQSAEKQASGNGLDFSKQRPRQISGAAPVSMSMREAVVWAEILGEPVSQKRRRRRVNLHNGNQSNANRR